MFVIAHQEIDYKAPVFYADTLDIQTAVGSISAAKIEFIHEIRNISGGLITKAKTTAIYVDKSFKPKPIPDEIKKKLAAQPI